MSSITSRRFLDSPFVVVSGSAPVLDDDRRRRDRAYAARALASSSSRVLARRRGARERRARRRHRGVAVPSGVCGARASAGRGVARGFRDGVSWSAPNDGSGLADASATRFFGSSKKSTADDVDGDARARVDPRARRRRDARDAPRRATTRDARARRRRVDGVERARAATRGARRRIYRPRGPFACRTLGEGRR